jgi:hypothetical protein
VTSMAAGRAERLATLAVHTPCAGIPSRTSQRILPWLGRHHFASRVLASTGRRELDLSSHIWMSAARGATAATVSWWVAGSGATIGTPRSSDRLPTAAGGARRRAARQSWSETPPRCLAAPAHRRAAPGRRPRRCRPGGPPRWRHRPGPSAQHPLGLGQGPAKDVGDPIASGIPRGGTDGRSPCGAGGGRALGAGCGWKQPASHGQHSKPNQQHRRGRYPARCRAHAGVIPQCRTSTPDSDPPEPLREDSQGSHQAR